jgi:hypothetical protein
MRSLLLSCLLLAATAARASAVQIVQFTFNTADGNAATGTLAPSIGAGTLAIVGGPTTFFGFGSGSSDPAVGAENSAWGLGGFPSAVGDSGTVGWQLAASTVGYQAVTLAFDQKNQPSSGKFYEIQVRTTPVGPFVSVATYGIVAADVWENQKSFNLSALLPAATNNPDFAVRVVGVVDPVTMQFVASEAGYNGQIPTLFDVIALRGDHVPEPAAAVLAVGVGAAWLGTRRRIRV